MRQAVTVSQNATVLNSWKEIAIYIGRGVRTVQRWERDLGLPVHRPRGKQRSAVLAIPEELDYWIHNTPGRARGEYLLLRENSVPPVNTPVRHTTLSRAEVLCAETRDLRARSAVLLKQLMESTQRQYEGTSRLMQNIRKINGGVDPVRESRTERAVAS